MGGPFRARRAMKRAITTADRVRCCPGRTPPHTALRRAAFVGFAASSGTDGGALLPPSTPF